MWNLQSSFAWTKNSGGIGKMLRLVDGVELYKDVGNNHLYADNNIN